MRWLREAAFRLQSLFWKRKIETELSDEIRTHLEMQTEENLAAGIPPEEARYAALRRFGAVEQIKEEYRDRRGIPWIEEMMQDFRYAVRMFRRERGFTVTALLILAVGIGLNTTVFSLVNTVV